MNKIEDSFVCVTSVPFHLALCHPSLWPDTKIGFSACLIRNTDNSTNNVANRDTVMQLLHATCQYQKKPQLLRSCWTVFQTRNLISVDPIKSGTDYPDGSVTEMLRKIAVFVHSCWSQKSTMGSTRMIASCYFCRVQITPHYCRGKLLVVDSKRCPRPAQLCWILMAAVALVQDLWTTALGRRGCRLRDHMWYIEEHTYPHPS